MAAKKKEKDEGYVTVQLPRAGAHEQQVLFVSVNGKTWSVEKGKKVKVPFEVAEVIHNSEVATEKAISFIEENAQE